MKRAILHKDKLEDFKKYLDCRGIAYRPGKGDYQVLQVDVPSRGWQAVYSRNDMPEHFTVNFAMLDLVRDFIASKDKVPAALSKELDNLRSRVYNAGALIANAYPELGIELGKIAEELRRLSGETTQLGR